MKKQQVAGSERQEEKNRDAKQIQVLEAKIQELTDDLQRVQADFVNYRARAKQQMADSNRQGRIGIILKLLPTIDNLCLALNHQPKELADNKWAQGVTGVARQLDKVLREIGVEKIESVGKEFDPNLHEAVQMEGGEGDHELVTAELQSGYLLNNEVIRPAMVKVAHRDQNIESGIKKKEE